jgi:membrane dipeptidase
MIDAHNHLLMSHAVWDSQAPEALAIDAIVNRLSQGQLTAVGMVIGGDQAFPSTQAGSSWEGTLCALAQYWGGIARASHSFITIRNADDLNALSDENPGCMLCLEGMHACFDSPFQDPLAALRLLVQLGIRSIQFVAAPQTPLLSDPESGPRRLTETGREMLSEANRLHLVIDVSHLSGDEPAFLEILEHSSSPPIASHHSCRSITGNPQALSDEAIRALASAGGVIGIHVGSHWLNNESRQATADDFLMHVTRIVDLVGIDYVAIGTDHVDTSALPRELPEGMFMSGFGGPEDFHVLAEALAGAGYSASDCGKVLSSNVRRVWQAALMGSDSA